MFVSHRILMENPKNGRRHGRLRNLLTTLAFGGLLAGCDATASDKNKSAPTPEKDVTSNSGEVTTKKFTRDECLSLLPDKPKFKTCMIELNKQLELENTVKRKELERLNQTLEALEKIKAATLEQEPNR